MAVIQSYQFMVIHAIEKGVKESERRRVQGVKDSRIQVVLLVPFSKTKRGKGLGKRRVRGFEGSSEKCNSLLFMVRRVIHGEKCDLWLFVVIYGEIGRSL